MRYKLKRGHLVMVIVFAGCLGWPVTGWSQNVAGADSSTATVPAGINDRFLDPELNVAEFVDRFERESREVFAAREAILTAAKVTAGMRVADIGAGTGLFTVLFSHEVGDSGWVYSVDISPRFVEHVAKRAEAARLENVTPVLCTANSVNLPPASIDLAFVCDTYHHFEYPADTLGSIHAALRAEGLLVVVDFHRIPGVSSEWILGHVRAGQEVFAEEIRTAGFQLVDEPLVKGLAENYFLVFRKGPLQQGEAR